MDNTRRRWPTSASGPAPTDIAVSDIKRLGIVSRDYNDTFPNGRRDFSHALPSVLQLLDQSSCDAVVFSMYTIIPGQSPAIASVLDSLTSIKVIFAQEFEDGERRRALRNLVYYRSGTNWLAHEMHQKFGSLRGQPRTALPRFISGELPTRILGRCCALLCGELNGLRYSKKKGAIEDTAGFMAAIPDDVTLVVNPGHDRMTRFEMRLKRRFLSRGRWVVSVWNKGKANRDGKCRDGARPAWDVYYDGSPMTDAVRIIPNPLKLEVGVLDLDAKL